MPEIFSLHFLRNIPASAMSLPESLIPGIIGILTTIRPRSSSHSLLKFFSISSLLCPQYSVCLRPSINFISNRKRSIHEITCSIFSHGTKPHVSTAVLRPFSRQSRAIPTTKSGCISGSPPENVMPPPEFL